MRNTFILILLILAVSCRNNSKNISIDHSFRHTDKIHTSQNSLDWEGRYIGVLPCADCEGIETSLVLKGGEYKLSQFYLGKNVRPVKAAGELTWNPDGNSITIASSEIGTMTFQVGEGYVQLIGDDGKSPDGELADNYKLKLMYHNPDLENKNWVLIELSGKTFPETERDDPYFILDFNSGSLSGSLWCNRIFGNYELIAPNGISLGELGTTMMSCPELEWDNALLTAFKNLKTYTVNDPILTLHDRNNEVLAVFKVAEEEEEE